MSSWMTYLGSDLVSALAGLNVDDFSHVGSCRSDVCCLGESVLATAAALCLSCSKRREMVGERGSAASCPTLCSCQLSSSPVIRTAASS